MKQKFLLILFLALSCSEHVISPPEPESSSSEESPKTILGGVTTKSRVREISSYGVSSVGENTLTLSSSQNVKTGDILLCRGVSSQVPHGFLRKVVSTYGWSVQTTNVALSEAFSEGKVVFSTSSASLNKQNVYRSFEKQICEGVTLSGGLTLNPALSGQISFPKNFELSSNVSGQLSLSLVIDKEVQFYQETQLFTISGSPIIAGPIVVTPELSVFFQPNIHLNGRSEFVLSDIVNFSSSVSYNGKWSATKELVNSFEVGEVEATFDGEVIGKLLFRISIYFYEAVGVSVEIGPYADLEIDTSLKPIWKFYAGADGKLKVGARGIFSEVPDYSLDLFDEKVLVAESETENLPPTAVINFSPSEGTTETVFSFSSMSSVDDGPKSELLCRWDWESNGWDTEWQPLGITEHQYTSGEGWYVLALEVRDSEGLASIEKKKIHIVKEENPGEQEGTPVFYSSESVVVGFQNLIGGTESYFKFTNEDPMRVVNNHGANGEFIETEVLLKFNINEVPTKFPRKIILRIPAYGTEASSLEIGKINETWNLGSVDWLSKPSKTLITYQPLTVNPTIYEVPLQEIPLNGISLTNKNSESVCFVMKSGLELEVTY